MAETLPVITVKLSGDKIWIVGTIQFSSLSICIPVQLAHVR
jgi:hypothetical protein